MTTAELPATLPNVTGRGTPSASAIRVLTRIAEEHWWISSPTYGALAVQGETDAGLPFMPRTYTPTVREFERLARVMRDDRAAPLQVTASGEKVSLRKLAWHLREYHLNAQHVIRWKPVAAKKGKRKATLRYASGKPVTRPERAVLRHPDARKDLAELAIRWIAAHWSLPVEPMLPDEVRQVAA